MGVGLVPKQRVTVVTDRAARILVGNGDAKDADHPTAVVAFATATLRLFAYRTLRVFHVELLATWWVRFRLLQRLDVHVFRTPG